MRTYSEEEVLQLIADFANELGKPHTSYRLSKWLEWYKGFKNWL